MMMKVGMEFWIDYSHHLKGHDLCGRIHGHTAHIIVEIGTKNNIPTVKNNYNDAMLIDFKDLKIIIKSVIDKLDHNDLNIIFEYPTAEVICNWIWDNLSQKFNDDIFLQSVRFYEGNGKYVEITI